MGALTKTNAMRFEQKISLGPLCWLNFVLGDQTKFLANMCKICFGGTGRFLPE
jgi:hypothetical protein